jgi:hypothetical protein
MSDSKITLDDLRREAVNSDYAYCAWAVAEIERLQAIVDQLPTTADKYPMTPGLSVWVIRSCLVVERRVSWIESELVGVTVGLVRATVSIARWSDCFAVRENAEAAMKARVA